jgi:predicted nucleic acid-binding protein
MQYLVDTGVLLRLFDRTDPNHIILRQGLQLLRRAGHSLAMSSQNIAEFWNVSTRPSSARGGYGQDVVTTERRVQFLEKIGTVHLETAATYQAWRRLLIDHAIQGLNVHDSRLVALMEVIGIKYIITLNPKDFARYRGIVALLPGEIADSIA